MSYVRSFFKNPHLDFSKINAHFTRKLQALFVSRSLWWSLRPAYSRPTPAWSYYHGDSLFKAEPFKMWLAQVGRERIEETIDPELTIERALDQLQRGHIITEILFFQTFETFILPGCHFKNPHLDFSKINAHFTRKHYCRVCLGRKNRIEHLSGLEQSDIHIVFAPKRIIPLRQALAVRGLEPNEDLVDSLASS